MSNTRYVAFLRGINVGGKMVKMEKLRVLLESMDFKNVKTLLNSGNVVFDADQTDIDFTSLLETRCEKEFGFHIDILIRRMIEMQELVKSKPFEGIPISPQTRFYITFLSENKPLSLKIPYESEEKDFQIVAVEKGYVVSVITLSTNTNTTDMMKLLQMEFGKRITTRNWNTVLKIASLG
ncbi:DUF1697 domain-containing protein [Candidatus Woesebacteria bacterium]|nr:DUF1697 domain-containing protein [Candidatus Woesebacteria bacterium]